MTRTFEIVRDLVNSMDLSIKVNEIDGNVLKVCRTLHVRNNSIVKDGEGNEYKVTSFVNNKSITVEPFGEYVFTGDFVFAPSPVFLQGKWISANQEYLNMDLDTRQKTPLIWLVRGYEERLKGAMSSVKLEVEPLIFFLDEADFTSWVNDEHDVKAINPMYNLAELFVETIESNPQFKTLEGWKIQDEPRFGVKITTEKGNSKRILSDDLSGVGLRVPIKYFGSCKHC